MGDAAIEQTFAFVDLAGFTALTEACGDEEAAELAERLVELTEAALVPGVRLIKAIGDAVLLAAADPAYGLATVKRLIVACYDSPGFPVVRAGLHHGSAVERRGDVYGAAVNLTARVVGQASGGQVLATADVAQQARSEGIEVIDLGSFSLRNVTDPVGLFDIALCAQPESGAIDPVCRMFVQRSKAAGRLRHGGADWWFCSLDCAARFATDPDRHVNEGRVGPSTRELAGETGVHKG